MRLEFGWSFPLKEPLTSGSQGTKAWPGPGRGLLLAALAAMVVAVAPRGAMAQTDEIQVYNGQIAEPGVFRSQGLARARARAAARRAGRHGCCSRAARGDGADRRDPSL